jgi:hypothetical protein
MRIPAYAAVVKARDGTVSDTFTCAMCHGLFVKTWSDEEAWAEAEELFGAEHLTDPALVLVDDPARVLRDVEAKRALLDDVLGYESTIDGEWGCCHSGQQIADGKCPEIHPGKIPALRHMAFPYADRPGYRPEWRPEAE